MEDEENVVICIITIRDGIEESVACHLKQTIARTLRTLQFRTPMLLAPYMPIV